MTYIKQKIIFNLKIDKKIINRPNLSLGNGEDWWGYTQDGYERGQTPKLGATICFRNQYIPFV